MKTPLKRKIPRGFSLIELLIVITIIGIISAIAVPNLLRARRSANEASAVASIGLIHRCEMAYKFTEGNGVFTTISTLASNGCLDSTFSGAASVKSGYEFQLDILPLAPNTEPRFDLRARPLVHELVSVATSTGSHDFGTNESGGKFTTVNNTPVTFDATTRLATGTAVPYE